MSRSSLLLCCAVSLVLGTAGCSSAGSSAAPGSSGAPDAVASDPAEAGAGASRGPSPMPPPASAAPAALARIVIAGFAYEVPASVPAGATVEVVNDDDQAHTVTLADAEVDAVVQAGQTVRITAPAEPGEYSVVCHFHGNMTATLVVV